MKNIILITILFLGLISTFKAFGHTSFFADLTSTTVIEPNKSFVLGEGKHDGYRAKLVNKGNVDIEIFTEVENENAKSVGVLKPNDKVNFSILKNTKVIFKNLGQETATIGIKLSGDTNLSMGYKPNNL
jgi:hypothetical protein